MTARRCRQLALAAASAAGLLAILAAACGSGGTAGAGTPTQSPTATATGAEPTATPALAARDLSALPPALAETVRAVELPDADAVVARIVYKREGCVAVGQLGTPPQCEPGQPVGTLVDAFTVVGCDGSDVPPADAERAVRNVVARPLRLYAVWRPAEGSAGGAAEFHVMFVSPEDPSQEGTWLTAAADGTFNGIWGTCGSPDDFLARSRVKDFVIPPP